MRQARLLLAGALIWALPGSALSISPPQEEGLRLEAKPLRRAEVVSFYLGRGLTAAAVEPYARNCVVRLVLKNSGTAAGISTTINEWNLLASGRPPRRIEGRSHWVARIDQLRPSLQARMAFEWSQLPDVVQLGAGDSVQGMVSLPLRRGVPFEIVVPWKADGRTFKQSTGRLRCD